MIGMNNQPQRVERVNGKNYVGYNNKTRIFFMA
jgi:hypothetical protein